MTKRKLILLILLISPLFIFAQEEEAEEKESIYLDDVSDPVKPYGHGPQIQISSFYESERYAERFILPRTLLKYSFNNRVAVYGIVENPIEYLNLIDGDVYTEEPIRENRIKEMTLGGVYALDEEVGFGPFKEFTFVMDNDIPICDCEHYKANFDVNWVTEFSDRLELDYILRYRYKDSEANKGYYNLQLDYYFSPTILFEIGNQSDWEWKEMDSTFRSYVFTEFAFLSRYRYQFNVSYLGGINHKFHKVGFTLAFTMTRDRKELD